MLKTRALLIKWLMGNCSKIIIISFFWGRSNTGHITGTEFSLIDYILLNLCKITH